jgi:phosphoglycolate phosphatase
LTVVLFDVDGTLVRTAGSGRRALDRAFEKLWGLKNASKGVDFSGKPDQHNFREVYEKRFGRKAKASEIEAAMDAYLSFLPSEVRRSVREGGYKLIPGVKELLKALSKRPGVMVGLGTGNLEKGARIKLGPSGLNRYFSFGGYGCDHIERHRILKAAVKRAGVRAKDVVIVGDTPRDIEAGRKAGFRTAVVTAGFATAAALKAAKPDHLARDFRPLDRWLGWLGGTQ